MKKSHVLSTFSLLLLLVPSTSLIAQDEDAVIDFDVSSLQWSAPTVGEIMPVPQAWGPPQPLLPPQHQHFTMETVDGSTVVYAMPALGGYGSSETLLHDKNVIKDLEIVDDQIAEIKRIRKDFQKKTSDMFKAAQSAEKGGSYASNNVHQKMIALQKEQKEAIEGVLLPHQRDRIKQIGVQMEMQSHGSAHSFQHGTLSRELEITPEQKKKMTKLQQEMQKEIMAKTKAIQEAAKKKMMAELTPEQQSKLKGLIGDKFERKQPPNVYPPTLNLSKPAVQSVDR